MAISTTEAAAILEITPRRIRALIKSKRLPARRMGRDWYIQPADVEKIRVRATGRPRKKSENNS